MGPTTQPVCSSDTSTCTSCTLDAECDRFGGPGVCVVDTGACISCFTDADCAAPAHCYERVCYP